MAHLIAAAESFVPIEKRGPRPRREGHIFAAQVEAKSRPLAQALNRELRGFARRAAKAAAEGTTIEVTYEDRTRLFRALDHHGARQMKESAQAAAKQVEGESGLSDAALHRHRQMKAHQANRYLVSVQDEAQRAAKEVRDQMARDGISLSRPQMVRAIQARLEEKGPLSPQRIDNLARSQIVEAANQGRVEVYRAENIPEIEWVTAGDSDVRSDHRRMSGIRTRVGEPFRLPGGVLLDYPGDPTGPIEQIINCRCTVRPVRSGGKAIL